MKNKILLICYSYTPMITPNAFRWTNIAEYWANQGKEIHVICAWKPGLKRYELREGVHIYRVGGNISEKIRSHFLKFYVPNELNCTNSKIGKEIKTKFSYVIKMIHDLTWKKIYWPDYACLWFFPAISKAEYLIRMLKTPKLLSVSIPFTAHLVGNNLKKKHPRIHWVVDIIDPFSFLKSMPTNNHFIYSKLNNLIERKIFRNAKAVSVLTPNIKNKYSELFPESAYKIFINPNIFIHTKKYHAYDSWFPKEKKRRLVFIGTLNKKIRSPEHLLKLFQILLNKNKTAQYELHFFGNIYSCIDNFIPYRRLLGKYIFIHGVISKKQAFEAMLSSDIMINIGNKNPYQEPSKIIEYAASGKPIINITTIKDDSSSILLENYPSVINVEAPVSENDNNKINMLIKFIENPPRVEKKFINKWLIPYKVETIASTYEMILNKL